MRDVTALKQVKFTVFHDFEKAEIFHRLCTFPWMGMFSSNPYSQNTSAACRNTCVQSKTLWNSHQELFCFSLVGLSLRFSLKSTFSS